MNDTGAIVELEQQLAQAWVLRDRGFIDDVLAAEWTVTDPSGRVLTKQQVLDETFSSDERTIDSMTVDEIVVRLFGMVAVATGRTRAAGSYKGERASVELRFTDVLQKHGDRWRFVVSQGTFVAR
ncbi:MAG TPA: nuclear transport factor 2 family protein [Vicinamibacterales bacterium]|jgi:ketosteroid isomerase-like protein|nr:nuclear transport factor 2 family protein [Vicinamibacterales bacterium]